MSCDGNDYVTNFRDGVLILRDGAGVTLEVPLEMGDVAIGGLSADMTEVAVYQSRGRTKAVRRTNDVQPTLAFSAMLGRLSSSKTATTVPAKPAVMDFILRRNAYATNIRSSSICGDVYTLDAKWQLTTPDGVEYVELRAVAFTVDLSEGDPNSISLSGTVYDPDVIIVGAV